MNGGDEAASAPEGRPQPLEWKFSQVFGERAAGEELQEVDIISAIEFDRSGDHLAIGDRGGRVVLFERTDAMDNGGSRRDLERMDYQVDQYMHRLLVEEDANSSSEGSNELIDASSEVGQKLYRKGDFAESQITNLDSYLLKKVGLFPDIIESKVARHLDQGDHISAMITGEFYTRKEHFPGFGRPFVFYAEILQKVGRISEAKDAARASLKSPWWTLGCPYQEAADLAQWEDEQIEYIKEKVTEEGRQDDLKKGKVAAQIVLDEAAFLLDLASVEGNWADYVDRIAECYREAGLDDIAKFVSYKE